MQPFFLTADDRRLFCLFTEASRPDSRAVLLLPPLAEDMNQVRSFHARVARALAERGVASLAVDVSASGDSSGEFRDATVAHWAGDITAAADWLASRAAVVDVLAVRSAALHLPALTAPGRTAIGRVCLVDPVCTGDEWLDDFLRVKVGRSMFEGRRETVASLRERLVAGELLEVAGYELSPALFLGLAALRLEATMLAGVDALQLVRSRDRAAADQDCKGQESLTKLSDMTAVQRIDLDYTLLWSSDRVEPPRDLLDAVVDYFLQ